MKKEIRWLVFQPLIGGFPLGAEKAFNSIPTSVLDYKGVENSKLYVQYMNEIKGHTIEHFYLKDTLYSFNEELENTTWNNEKFQNLDVVVGVPICSGLTTANTQTFEMSDYGYGSDSLHNNNMLGMLNIVTKYLKPKAYIFENAYKFATHLGDGIREKIIKISNEADYGVNIVKVDTLNHGLPQKRTRVFVTCVKNSNAPLYQFNPVEPPQIMDIIGDLKNQVCPFPARTSEDGWIKYLKSKFGENYREEWCKINCAADFVADSLNELLVAKEFFITQKEKDAIDRWLYKKSMGKGWMSSTPTYYGLNKLSSLYGRSMSRLWHPTEERGYSIREFMRLMGLPDDMPEVKYKNINMIGQNVPVCTGNYYCNELKEFLEGNRQVSEKLNVIQDFSKQSVKNKENKQTGFGKFFKN